MSERSGTPPDPSACLRISAISGASPAASAGLVQGDLLADVDGTPAFELDRRLYTDFVSARRYRFWSMDRALWVEVEATGVEIGVVLRPTAAMLLAHWDPFDGSDQDLFEVWQSGDWGTLGDLAWMRCHGARRPPGVLSFLSSMKRQDTPALLYLGAAQWELGKRARGMKLIAEYAAEHAGRFAAEHRAVAWYYVAQRHLDDGHPARALKFVRQSLDDWWLPRAEELCNTLATEPVVADPWRMQPFPKMYALPPLDADPAMVAVVSLAAALQDMQPWQVLIVCLLGGERGGAAYNDLMFRYLNYQGWLPAFIAGLHVITSRVERDLANDQWWEAEDLARAQGLPLQVLIDEYGRVVDKVEPRRTPLVYVLDKRGTVLHEGDLEAPALWDSIALASLQTAR